MRLWALATVGIAHIKYFRSSLSPVLHQQALKNRPNPTLSLQKTCLRHVDVTLVPKMDSRSLSARGSLGREVLRSQGEYPPAAAEGGGSEIKSGQVECLPNSQPHYYNGVKNTKTGLPLCPLGGQYPQGFEAAILIPPVA